MNKNYPVLTGILPYNKSFLITDIIAGLTLAAVAIPMDMGYTKIAGMPVETGLYCLLFPCIAFAIFGASRNLVVGADSASAAILAGGLVAFASIGSPEYIKYAALLAIMVGILLFACWLFRLSFIANFLSRTVLTGFLAGVGIQVAISQFPELFGLTGISGNAIEKCIAAFSHIGALDGTALIIAIITLAFAMMPKIFGKRNPLIKKIPWALIAIIGIIAAGYSGFLGADKIAFIGNVSAGLPDFALPAFDWKVMSGLIGTALSITVIIITQSAATVSVYAIKHDEDEHSNKDIIGLGMANLLAGLTGTFCVNGSPTKTEVADSSGSRSQVANLVSAGVVILVLLFLTGFLKFIPEATLAAIVFATGLGLIDIGALIRVYKIKKAEFIIAVITAATVIIFGAVQGIILAMILSIIEHLRHSYSPKTEVYKFDHVSKDSGKDKGKDLSTGEIKGKWVPVQNGITTKSGIALYRFSSSIYYANTKVFKKDILTIMGPEGQNKADMKQPKKIALDFSATSDVDFSGGEMLKEVYKETHRRGISLSVVLIEDSVLDELKKSGFIGLIDEHNVYPDIKSLIARIEVEEQLK